MDAAAALAVAGQVGPFFQVEAWRPGRGWRPLAELTEPGVLAERVALAREVIAAPAGVPAGSIELRVAGSITFLGLAARLLSPPLGAAVLTGVVPQVTVAALWWQPVPGGPWPLAAGPLATHPAGDPDTTAAALARTVGTGVIAPVLAAFGATFRISPQVLWGNVASGLGGAAGVLASARPDRATATAELAQRLLDRPPLRGTGQLRRVAGAAPRLALRRRSCCLFYRVPGAGLCGDCVLAPADANG
jgi:hypothetical protein